MQMPLNLRRRLGRLATLRQSLVVSDRLIRIDSDALCIRPHEAPIENSARQQMERFVFDGREESNPDACLGCDLIQ